MSLTTHERFSFNSEKKALSNFTGNFPNDSKFNKFSIQNINKNQERVIKKKQAGAELGQAQLKLGFDLNFL